MRDDHIHQLVLLGMRTVFLLWPLYGIGQAIIFSFCGFCFSLSLSFFFSSTILSRRKLDVYHTSVHGVALVRI